MAFGLEAVTATHEIATLPGGQTAFPPEAARREPADAPDEIVLLAREQLKKGSTSFFKAARLFPKSQKASAFLLYAWCRHCDDEIDGQILGAAPDMTRPPCQRSLEARERTLATLREKTVAALAGQADEPVFVGLQRVVASHQIPHRYPLDLIEGMAMDVRGRSYACLEDTLSYSYYVAGVVGVMMATIMGVRDRATLERASDLGIAFQLTNIVRDVVADAALGRFYLPQNWLDEVGILPCEIGERRHREKVFRISARLLDVADDYYRSALIGIGRLPFRSAWAIASARRIYRGIGQAARASGAAAWDRRARAGTITQASGIALGAVEAAVLVSLRGRSERKPRLGLWTPSHLWTS
ncbi:phytoene/squalene synthase family protein [Methylocella silvestris]|nr:phytoene/squalene synthase family protein [Methylocella silvestris]